MTEYRVFHVYADGGKSCRSLTNREDEAIADYRKALKDIGHSRGIRNRKVVSAYLETREVGEWRMGGMYTTDEGERIGVVAAN